MARSVAPGGAAARIETAVKGGAWLSLRFGKSGAAFGEFRRGRRFVNAGLIRARSRRRASRGFSLAYRAGRRRGLPPFPAGDRPRRSFGRSGHPLCIVKYSNDGELLCMQKLTEGSNSLNRIAVNDSGDVFITSSFSYCFDPFIIGNESAVESK